MITSVEEYNKDSLTLYISVPEDDLPIFKNHIDKKNIILFSEREIVEKIPRLNIKELYAAPGWIRQQVIKSEFWRLEYSDNYLVIDSDCVFIRDFRRDDFIYENGTPYSIIHEGREFLQTVATFGPKRARNHFLADRLPIKSELSRNGVTYDYGYAPFLWSAKVWISLYDNYLNPKGISFLEAIKIAPSEFTWYGEALLKYQAIKIYPREQFFMHYHYEAQLWLHRLIGVTKHILSKDYMGIVNQSNWETWLDFGVPEKKFTSRIIRAFKRKLKKIKFTLKILSSLLFK
jgi:hypothetical protein